MAEAKKLALAPGLFFLYFTKHGFLLKFYAAKDRNFYIRRAPKERHVESFEQGKQKYPQLKMRDKFIIYTKNLEVKDGFTYLPVYMAGLI